MAMEIKVSITCDDCLIHRDLTVGDPESMGMVPVSPMLVRYRAREIGWKIHPTNANILCVCPRCANKRGIK